MKGGNWRDASTRHAKGYKSCQELQETREEILPSAALSGSVSFEDTHTGEQGYLSVNQVVSWGQILPYTSLPKPKHTDLELRHTARHLLQGLRSFGGGDDTPITCWVLWKAGLHEG